MTSPHIGVSFVSLSHLGLLSRETTRLSRRFVKVERRSGTSTHFMLLLHADWLFSFLSQLAFLLLIPTTYTYTPYLIFVLSCTAAECTQGVSSTCHPLPSTLYVSEKRCQFRVFGFFCSTEEQLRNKDTFVAALLNSPFLSAHALFTKDRRQFLYKHS